MHATINPPAFVDAEGVRLGIFQVVCNLVEERVEQLLQGPSSELGVVGVDPNQASRFVVTTEDPVGRSCVHIEVEA